MQHPLWLLSLVFSVVLAGCAAPRPVLYPNEQLERVGQERADLDLAECQALAQEAEASGGAATEGEKIAKESATRAGAGAAAGAVGGAIRGSNVGIAAAVGGAAAATYGAVRGGLRWLFGAKDPDPIEKRFVNRCLRDRGYDVLGWR